MRKKFLTILMSMLMVFVMMPMGTWTTYAAGGNLSQDADGYYLIEDYNDLKAFAKHYAHSYNARLTNDITCTDDDWVTIGNGSVVYDGTFDGDGHIIKGLSNKSSGAVADTQGLIGQLGFGGKVINVGIEGGSITGIQYVGSIVGINYGEIINCYNTGEVNGTETRVGGIAGMNFGVIKNCYNTGKISVTENYIGGITGYNFYDNFFENEAEITNCYNTGSISCTEEGYAGGIAGLNERAKITNCYNTGKVSSTGIGACGVVGINFAGGKIENCYLDSTLNPDLRTVYNNSGEVDINSVRRLPTTQMTGTNALRYMPFTNQDPWLTKADGEDPDTSEYYRYYPHLKGFNLDSDGNQVEASDITPADWPPKETVKAEWNGSEPYTYNGSAQGSLKQITISNGSTDVTVDPNNYTVSYYVKDGDNYTAISEDIVNVGSYKAVITFKTGGHPSIEKEFEIDKAPLTITAKDQTYEYNGQEQGEGDPAYDDAAVIAEKVTVKGLQGNDQITSLVLMGQKKEIGEAAIEITGFSINNNDAAKDNYIVTLVPGKLTITGHTLTKTDEVPATCEKDGTKAYWTCSTCKKMFSDEKGENVITAPEVIKATGHELTKTDEVPATCEKDGTKAYWTCSKCKKMFSDEKGENVITAPEVIKASGHDWGEWTVTKKATETEDGEEQRVCKNDPEHKETRVIPATGHVHKLTETPAKAATCTEDGNSAYWKCDKGDNPCGKYFSDAEGTKEIEKDSWVIKASGHDWGEWTVTKEATETEEGEEQRVCKNDPEHKETRVIPVIGHEHKLTETPAKAATCTEDGNSAYWTCDKGDNPCGRYFSDAEGTTEIEKDSWVITATGHDWGEWTVTKEATETEEGEEQRVCKNDPEHKETRAIPVIPAKVTYSNVSGEGNTWYKGSDSTSDFAFKRSVDDASTFSHFTGIRVDNTAVDEANYSKESGSVIIKLKPEYLETLALGKHTLEARFDDGNGSASAEFTIAEAEEEENTDDEDDDVNGNSGGSKGSKKSVRTGDESLVAFWASLLGVSLIGLIMLFAARLRLRRKDR